MIISLQINGSPTELQQVLSAIGTISPSENTNIGTELVQEEQPKKTATSKKAEQKPKATVEAPKTEEAQPEEPKQPEPAKTEATKRVDLEAIRKEFGPRYMNAAKKASVVELLSSFGHEKLGPFYEAASEEQKSEFYDKLIAI